MARTTRRQLLKSGAGGAAALAALGGGATSAQAQGRTGLHVHIHGVLVNPAGVQLPINIDVAGRPDDLAGAGWDAGTGTTGVGMLPGGPPPAGPIGACYYTAAGQLVGDTVMLQGRSLLNNRPLSTQDVEDPGKSDTRADGRLMEATANVDTGEIVWSLTVPGATPVPFTGTGVVMVTHASRASK